MKNNLIVSDETERLVLAKSLMSHIEYLEDAFNVKDFDPMERTGAMGLQEEAWFEAETLREILDRIPLESGLTGVGNN